MQIGIENLTTLVAALITVMLLSIGTIIILWVRYKRIAYAWFLAQIILLCAAFLVSIKPIAIGQIIPVDVYVIALLWICSMLCMFIGLFCISRRSIEENKPASGRTEYAPNLIAGLGMLAFYVLPCTLVPEIASVVASGIVGFSDDDPLVYVCTTLSALLLLTLWLNRKYTINFRSIYSTKKVSAILLLPMIMAILGLGILVSEADNILETILPVNDYWLEFFNAMSGQGFATWREILASVVTAPIVEETIFRGMLLNGFLKHYSIKKSILLSALLFGIIHLNPWQFVTAFSVGIMLGWWYTKTGSVIPTIFGHALFNGMSFIMDAFGLSITGYNSASSIGWRQPVWFDLLGIILLSCGLICLTRQFDKRFDTERTVKIADQSNS